jgi:hypothetical protein
MRLLIGFFLVHIIVQSIISALCPYRDWADELDVPKFPKGLPDSEEREKILTEGVDDSPYPLTDRVMEAFDSVWAYHKPWPAPRAREALAKRAAKRRADYEEGETTIAPWVGDLADGGRFVVAWVGTRLLFQEKLTGYDQSWRMFSPNVGKRETLVRARLVYEDGSTRAVHSPADPEDLTCYRSMRFCSEKTLQYSTKLERDGERRIGYCNLVSHRYPTNGGSRLVKVQLIKIRYRYPAPGDDAYEALSEQTGPPGWEKEAPFYEYNVQTRKGKRLDK